MRTTSSEPAGTVTLLGAAATGGWGAWAGVVGAAPGLAAAAGRGGGAWALPSPPVRKAAAATKATAARRRMERLQPRMG